MKQLQNNYTTPEQSKRLMELGLPADSADCYYTRTSPLPHYRAEYTRIPSGCKPCWSVGRLIEIFELCNLYELHKFATRDWSVNIKKLMLDYEVAAEENMLDFSKLED